VISERCSCGAMIKTDEKDAIRLVREWRRKHICQQFAEQDNSPTHGTSETQIALGFQPGELPARSTDPWEDE
jgi:hypothetical protein